MIILLFKETQLTVSWAELLYDTVLQEMTYLLFWSWDHKAKCFFPSQNWIKLRTLAELVRILKEMLLPFRPLSWTNRSAPMEGSVTSRGRNLKVLRTLVPQLNHSLHGDLYLLPAAKWPFQFFFFFQFLGKGKTWMEELKMAGDLQKQGNSYTKNTIKDLMGAYLWLYPWIKHFKSIILKDCKHKPNFPVRKLWKVCRIYFKGFLLIFPAYMFILRLYKFMLLITIV